MLLKAVDSGLVSSLFSFLSPPPNNYHVPANVVWFGQCNKVPESVRLLKWSMQQERDAILAARRKKKLELQQRLVQAEREAARARKYFLLSSACEGECEFEKGRGRRREKEAHGLELERRQENAVTDDPDVDAPCVQTQMQTLEATRDARVKEEEEEEESYQEMDDEDQEEESDQRDG